MKQFRKHIILWALIGLMAQVAAQSGKPVAHTASPQVHLLDSAFVIPQLGLKRRICIYLPPDYAASRHRYPVLYLLDGQNLFDDAIANNGEWGIDESLDSLFAQGDPGCIVVAIDHAGRNRPREYRPYPSAVMPADPCCAADSMAAFVARTLKPYVDTHYRTRRGLAHTGIGGASTAAYFAQHVVHRYPRTFGRAMLFSPSYMHAERFYADAGAARLPRATHIYIVTGTQETALGLPPGQYAIATQRMRDTLLANGRQLDKTLSVQLRTDGAHAEWFWRREFPLAYRWLFDRRHGKSGTKGR